MIRGDVLADPKHRPAVTRRFAADLVWMDETAAMPGKRFLLKIGTATVPATLGRIADTLDVESLTRAPAASLVLNAIGRVEIEAAQCRGVRRLCREPPDRRLHPDRSVDAAHRGGRHGGREPRRRRATCIGTPRP